MYCFSFCLFGPENSKYYQGLYENLELINKHYPSWYTFVYMGNDVPESYVQRIGHFKNVILRHTGIVGIKNTIHRFFAVDEPNVDLMLVRDADSRVHWKDRWAITTFLQHPEKNCLLIRDHLDHGARIAAGMWGIRKGLLPKPMRTLFAEWKPIFRGSGDPMDPEGFGIDQNFLDVVIYPICDGSILTVTSISLPWVGRELRVAFPFKWDESIYVGRVESVPYTEPAAPPMFSTPIVNAHEVHWVPSQSVEWKRGSYYRRS